jgi:hypothetical protein
MFCLCFHSCRVRSVIQPPPAPSFSQETRHNLLQVKSYIIYPSLVQNFKFQLKVGESADDLSFYPELVLAGWNVDFAVTALPALAGRTKFRALHHIANSIMGIHRLDTVQQLRAKARQVLYR